MEWDTSRKNYEERRNLGGEMGEAGGAKANVNEGRYGEKKMENGCSHHATEKKLSFLNTQQLCERKRKRKKKGGWNQKAWETTRMKGRTCATEGSANGGWGGRRDM